MPLCFEILGSDEHVDWIERKLEPGDRLSIQIVDAPDPAPPVRRHADPELEAARERDYYEHLKKKFGD